MLSSGGAFAQNENATRAVWIASTQGDVSFLKAGADDSLWSPAEANHPLGDGNRLSTDNGSTALVRADAHVLHLEPSTVIEFGRIKNNVLVVDLKQGTMDADAAQLNPHGVFEVETPNVSMTLAQAGHYRFELDPQGNTKSITVHDGLCQAMSAGGQGFAVQAGQQASVSSTDAWQVADLPGSSTRSRQAPIAPRPQRSEPGIDTLNQYGTWRQTNYGMSWYPAVAPGWAPYTQGQWEYIEPGGWTWVDSEPWGFTPFHCGRWAFVGGAWCWIPGPPVYSPALVAWIGGGPGLIGMVGWFPLAPGEPYIAVGGYYAAGHIPYANIAFATVVSRRAFVSA